MRYLLGDFGGVGVAVGLRWIMLVESNRRAECVLVIFLERLIVIDLVTEIGRIILISANRGVKSTPIVVGGFKCMHFKWRVIESINMNTSD